MAVLNTESLPAYRTRTVLAVGSGVAGLRLAGIQGEQLLGRRVVTCRRRHQRRET